VPKNYGLARANHSFAYFTQQICLLILQRSLLKMPMSTEEEGTLCQVGLTSSALAN